VPRAYCIPKEKGTVQANVQMMRNARSAFAEYVPGRSKGVERSVLSARISLDIPHLAVVFPFGDVDEERI
jgi:hypothetical protein